MNYWSSATTLLWNPATVGFKEGITQLPSAKHLYCASQQAGGVIPPPHVMSEEI